MSLSTSSRSAVQLLPFRASASTLTRDVFRTFTTSPSSSSSSKSDNRDGSRRTFQSPVVKSSDMDTLKPTLDVAKGMPVGMAEMSNETLCTISALGNHDASSEVLKRHIMAVDNVDYDKARNTFLKIADTNRRAVSLAVYPYFIGIGAGMVGAFGSLPMVFDLNTAVWFNEFYVTTDIPEPKDLETMLEVGSWSWNWMEPPLGTLSFSLLCLQYAR
jgi:hypothetical protein